MGPIALFDKSFLQSLSVDESVWFDHFFYPVVCPLFYVETLADLEKAVREGRTPEQEVGIIADKTPVMHGGPCVPHQELCLAGLMGWNVPMTGQIPIGGGRLVEVEGKSGIIYEQTPEAKAFNRWQERKFLEVERDYAKAWRDSVNSLDLDAVAEGMRTSGINPRTFKTLEQAQSAADAVLNSRDRPLERIKFAFAALNIPTQFQRPILDRWAAHGHPPLSTYAPYTAHVLRVEIFFQVALGAGMIATGRPSNRIDISYLFYLPFSMIFVSSDRLHQRCAPIFLRQDQEFVWGEDLKADLKRINEHYLRLPDNEKEKGIMKFARRPPPEASTLIHELWKRHLNRSALEPDIPAERDPAKDKEMIEHLNKFNKAPAAPLGKPKIDSDDFDVVSIERLIQKRKGSWWQLPKDLKE